MKHLFAGALFALAAALWATPTVAKSSDASTHAVHIDRQCDRYGNFCSTPHYRKPKYYKRKKRPIKRKVRKVLHDYYDHKPFIERQCHRYGSFC